jgi:hypothetical protein
MILLNLNQIEKTVFKCILRLFCANKLNIIENNNIKYPLNLGACFDTNDNNIKRMFFNKNKKEPNYLLRRSRSYEVNNTDNLKVVYNGNISDYFCIPRFIIHDIDPRVISYYLSLSDNKLLLTCSTSPIVEPEHFTTELRETLLFVSNKDNIYNCFRQSDSNDIEDTKDLYYQIKDNGEWVQLLK